MAKREEHWAKRPFGYCGQELDRGQVFEFTGARNDEKLKRLGYVNEVPKGATLHECRSCGARFVDEHMRDLHGRQRHPERPRQFSPQEEDARAEREEKMLETVAPLNWENTAAARK